MKNQDIVLGAVMVLLALFGIFESLELPNGQSRVSSSFYPLLLFSFLGVVGFVLLIKAIIKKENKALPELKLKAILPVLGTLFIYVALLDRVGYVISTIIFVLVTMLLLGVRNKYQLLVVPLCTSFFIYLTFVYGFNIRLP